DFDTTHQINANWVWDLPFGRGRHWGGGISRGLDAVFGGWGLNGLVRWTSGFPFTVGAGVGWATDFELEGSSVLIGKKPATGVFTDASGDPTVFKNPSDLVCACGPGQLTSDATFRGTFPGESGERNIFRGPGFFGLDAGLSKTWNFSENKLVRFS